MELSAADLVCALLVSVTSILDDIDELAKDRGTRVFRQSAETTEEHTPDVIPVLENDAPQLQILGLVFRACGTIRNSDLLFCFGRFVRVDHGGVRDRQLVHVSLGRLQVPRVIKGVWAEFLFGAVERIENGRLGLAVTRMESELCLNKMVSQLSRFQTELLKTHG